MEIIRNFIEHVIGTSHLDVSTEEKKEAKPQIFKNSQKSDNFRGKVIENPSVKQREKSKYWGILSKFFFWRTPKSEPTVEEIGKAFLAKKYNSALSMIKQFKKDDETIIKLLEDVQNKIKELNEGDQESDRFITSIKDDFEAISAVREDHQLDPHQVLKIAFTVQECLSHPPPTHNTHIEKEPGIYLKKSRDLVRTLYIDQRTGEYYILNKGKVTGRWGLWSKSFLGKGCFKKVTTAIRVTAKKAKTIAQAVPLDHISEQALKTISSECKIALLLRGKPNLVSAHQIFLYQKQSTGKSKLSFMMEKCDTNLSDVRKSFEYTDESLCQIFEGAACAMQQMHEFTCSPNDLYPEGVKEGLVHADLKLDNMLLNQSENEKGELLYTVRFGDFGLTQDAKNPTPLFKSSEKFQPPDEDTPPTKAQDMYAVGCALYEFTFNKNLPWDKFYITRSEQYRQKKQLSFQLAKDLPKDGYENDTFTPKELRQYTISRLLDPNPQTRMNAQQFVEATEKLRNAQENQKK